MPAERPQSAVTHAARYGVQALAGTATIMFGGEAPAWGGEASLRWGPRSPNARSWSLGLGLGASAVSPSKASLHRYFASLWACPAPLAHTAVIDVQACARAEVGLLQAQGEGFAQTLTQTKLWTTAGPELRGTLNLGGSLALEAWGVPMVLLNRKSFTVHDVPVWNPSTIALRAGIGLEWRPQVTEP